MRELWKTGQDPEIVMFKTNLSFSTDHGPAEESQGVHKDTHTDQFLLVHLRQGAPSGSAKGSRKHSPHGSCRGSNSLGKALGSFLVVTGKLLLVVIPAHKHAWTSAHSGLMCAAQCWCSASRAERNC